MILRFFPVFAGFAQTGIFCRKQHNLPDLHTITGSHRPFSISLFSGPSLGLPNYRAAAASLFLRSIERTRSEGGAKQPRRRPEEKRWLCSAKKGRLGCAKSTYWCKISRAGRFLWVARCAWLKNDLFLFCQIIIYWQQLLLTGQKRVF